MVHYSIRRRMRPNIAVKGTGWKRASPASSQPLTLNVGQQLSACGEIGTGGTYRVPPLQWREGPMRTWYLLRACVRIA
jgi:hypothetical protein